VTSDLTVRPDEPTLLERRVDHPDAVGLLRAFYEEQVGRYGFAESIDLDPQVYLRPHGIFVVAYEGGRPVGCGGCRWYDRSDGVVEIKKTYLVPDARGHGLGRTLLTWLEARALGWGAERAILETGVRNSAALALFTSSGYRPTRRYVADRDPAINRAFTKPLSMTSQLPGLTAERANAR